MLHIDKAQLQTIVQNTNKEMLSQVRSLVIFLGHAHSGHSIIGAIMDAHPDVCISNEVNLAKLIRDHDLSKAEIEAVLYYYSQKNNEVTAWHNTEYKYNVPGGHQGETTQPLVIGDKKGGATTRLIMKNPNILDRLLDCYQNELKIINVHRNPLDIIAAYAYYWDEPIGMNHLKRFIENDQTNTQLKSKIDPSQWLDIQQSQFIENPVLIMSKIFDFIGVNASQDNLRNWTKIVKQDVVGKSKIIDIPKELISALDEYMTQTKT